MNASTASTVSSSKRRWYRRIGPGLITACVVIGPGSILTSSQVGASYGFQMIWVVVVAVFFMTVYTTLGARLGVVSSESNGTLVTQRAGRPCAVVIGLGVFFAAALFQFGNNLGVLAAFREFEQPLRKIPFFQLHYVLFLFNLLTISFLFAFRNLYRFIERMMMCLVGLMLLSFMINLCVANVSLAEFFLGFVPFSGRFVAETVSQEAGLNISLLGLVGTTFVVQASYFQSYLVQQKGWGKDELAEGIVDARVGTAIMAGITIMLMSTAAAELRGQQLGNIGDVAAGLKPAFGVLGHSLFCMGLFAAAYSSFLVNSMTGGFILSDSLGLGSKPTDIWPRLLTVAVLLTGMTVALLVHRLGFNALPAIVAAQAVTVVAAPIVALSLWWLTNRKDVMGEDRNGPVMNLLALTGFLLLLAMAWYTATYKVWPEMAKLLGTN